MNEHRPRPDLMSSKKPQKYAKELRKEVREKLNFKTMKIPKLKASEIEHNFEMIASEDEDYITLFKEGFITKLELIELLEEKASLF